MAMNPIDTTKRIDQDYQNYLKSILKVKNVELTQKAFKTLLENKFVKGPFLCYRKLYKSGPFSARLI